LHVWRISEGFDAITVHVTLKQGAHGVDVSREVSARIASDFGIHHVTVQPEAAAPTALVQLRHSKDGSKIVR
jgi:cobalt-zinc-cadmium efflux system protein